MADSILKKSLCLETIKLRLEAESKEDAIHELIDLLVREGKLEDREEALRVVLEREKVMSTGMEHGIAIPHGKTDTVSQLVVAVGIKPGGIEFDSADGEPATIILVTLSPASKSGPHLRFMAGVSRILSNAKLREQVLSVQSASEVLSLLTK